MLVSFPGDPEACSCGWYHFYAICGHLYTANSHACGKTKSQTSRGAVLYMKPGPEIIVTMYRISARCSICRAQHPGMSTYLGTYLRRTHHPRGLLSLLTLVSSQSGRYRDLWGWADRRIKCG